MMPKRVLHRKVQRGRMKGKATRSNFVAFGDYGLMSLGSCWLPARTIEAGRVAATHFLQREGRVWVRVFPHKPISKKPHETRMGKGKGDIEYWAAVVKPGQILYEIAGVPEDLAREALLRTAHKMPIKVKFVKRSAM